MKYKISWSSECSTKKEKKVGNYLQAKGILRDALRSAKDGEYFLAEIETASTKERYFGKGGHNNLKKVKDKDGDIRGSG